MIARKLEYLLALAKEGHFARAGAACNVSQPALSGGIQQLENELGVMIVKRGQRYMGLTEEGEIVLAWAQRSAIDCQRLLQELREPYGATGRHPAAGNHGIRHTDRLVAHRSFRRAVSQNPAEHRDFKSAFDCPGT